MLTIVLLPSQEGDLHVLIYLMGGCSDQVRSSDGANDGADEIPCWDVSSQTLTFDPVHHMFAKRANALRKRYRHKAVSIGGNIWVVGGMDAAGELVKEVNFCFD